MSKYYENSEKFYELNERASRCTILEFDEKRGLQPEDIAELLCNFREIIESGMSYEDYDDSDVQVISLHVGDDPAFLCYLGTTPLSEEEAQEVYEFLTEEDIEVWGE